MEWGAENARAAVGMAAIVAAAWALGGGKRPRLALIGGAIGLQFAAMLALFAAPPMREALFGLTVVVEALQDATAAGTAFVFGPVGGAPSADGDGGGGPVSLAFQILPLVMVISGLSAVLWRWRILPVITAGFAVVFRRALGLSGAASLAVAANIFMGMVEAPILVRPHLAKLSRSELFVLMTTGLATVAGTVLAIYAVFLGAILPDAAGHVLAASIISAPAAVLLGRLMVPPEPAESGRDGEQTSSGGPVVMGASPHASTLEALTNGVMEGLKLYLNIIAMLLVFVALLALVNQTLAALPAVAGAPLTVERLLGVALQPVIWAIGVPWREAAAAGGLFGVKTALNEFLAFEALVAQVEAGALSPRTALIMTYALCGFANFGSLAIMIAGLSTLMEDRRAEILALAPRALISGSLATLMTGCVVGFLPAALFGL